MRAAGNVSGAGYASPAEPGLVSCAIQRACVLRLRLKPLRTIPRRGRTFTLAGSLQELSGIGPPSLAYRTTHFVFQASWAALTFLAAVSSVKGGKGGLDSLAMFVGSKWDG